MVNSDGTAIISLDFPDLSKRSVTRGKRKPVSVLPQSDKEAVSAGMRAEIQSNVDSESGLEDEEHDTEPAPESDQVLESDEDVERNEVHRKTNDEQIDLNPREATLNENRSSIKHKTHSLNIRKRTVSNSPSLQT